MAHQTILIIRHGEKPEENGDSGVDPTGAPDKRSLTPRGWQRAGAWVQLFSPALNQQPAIPQPTALYASDPEKNDDSGSKSRRPLETITPLTEKLGIEPDTTFAKGSESALAEAVSATDGVVLICWQHEDIFAIANNLSPAPQGVPANWPGDRFNVVFRFDRDDRRVPWIFQQLVPVMLAGDESDEIS